MPPEKKDQYIGLKSPKDALSNELYSDPRNVSISFLDQSEVEAAELRILGKRLTNEEYMEIVAAPNGATIEITVASDKQIAIEIIHPYYATSQIRILEKQRRTVQIHNIFFKKESTAPKGLGVRVLARQVSALRRIGINKIVTEPDGHYNHPVFNGYYTWIRLGFNMDLSKMRALLDMSGFTDVQNTNELLGKEDGLEWWRLNGKQVDIAIFDVRETSTQSKMLTEYLKQRGISID